MKNCNFSTLSPSYHQHGKICRPKNMKKILMIGLLALSVFAASTAAPASAPKVRGTVKDAHGNPVAFSTVMFAPVSDTLAMRGDIANEQGYFDIPTGAGEHLVVVSMMGYESYRTTVTLTEDTVIANARFFGGDTSLVPRTALTVGVATILSAREVMILATGYAKAHAVREGVEGAYSHVWTITGLQVHPGAILVVDDAAATELKVSTYRYFKDIEKDNLR